MIRIGIVAPGRRLTEAAALEVQAIAQRLNLPLELVFHPQCFLDYGHFAGPDAARLEAFLDFANDPTLDAIWFARGGYGAARLLPGLPGRLEAAALNKVYLGYSDMGFLLAALTRLGCRYCAHGPVVGDVMREDGALAGERALRFLARTDMDGVDPHAAADGPNLAFNLTILRSLLGTDWLPTHLRHEGGAILWLEDVAEYAYATDRSLFQLTTSPWFKGVKGVRVGRFSLVPENDVPFPLTPEEAIAEWCARREVPILGHADIGHDVHNRIVPFGVLRDWQAAGVCAS
jgi:muramoyltetrapeptide carboxypeptidase